MAKVLMVSQDWRGKVKLQMAKFAFVDYTEASDFLKLVREKLGYEGFMQQEKFASDDARRYLRYSNHGPEEIAERKSE